MCIRDRFRADLYYRLNVFPVQVPPLRERIEDLPLLVEHFLSKFHLQYHKRTLGLSDKALALCLSYAWPGNIRELENVIERGVILTDSNETIGQDALFAVFPKAGNLHGDRLNADGALVQAEDRESAAAVSYTHLDVYKRQALSTEVEKPPPRSDTTTCSSCANSSTVRSARRPGCP